jgi:alpha-tubulin suppressor-like RCC1 family protein
MSVLDDGSLWAWGTSRCGCTGADYLPQTTYFNAPTRIGTADDWALAEAASGMQGYFTVALKTDGTLWTVGQNNQNDVLGPSQGAVVRTFTKVGEGFRVPAK